MPRAYVIYKPIIGWKVGQEPQKDSEGKTLQKLVIGEITENRKVQEYITEDIYESILGAILNHPKEYRIDVQIGKVPQLIIMYKGLIVMHNETIKSLLASIQEVLTSLPPEELLDAYYELRLNLNGKKRLRESTEIIVAKVRKESQINFSHIFIREATSRMLENIYYSTKDLDSKELLRSASYSELVELAIELLRFESTGCVKEMYLNSLLEETTKPKETMQEFRENLMEELLVRLTKGTLQER